MRRTVTDIRRGATTLLLAGALLGPTLPALADSRDGKYPGARQGQQAQADGESTIVRTPAPPAPAQDRAGEPAPPQVPETRSNAAPEKRVGVDESNPLPLSLARAIEMALERNRDIAVERINTQQAGYDVDAARGVYDPTLHFATSWQSTTTPIASVLGGSTDGSVTTRTMPTEVTLRKVLPTGGFFEVGASELRTDTDNTFASINPQTQTGLTFTFRQPLFKNFRMDDNRRRLLVARKRLDIGDAQFRQRVVETIGAVQRGYWDLEFALRNVQVARESVTLAETQLDRIRRLVDQGVNAPVDIVQVEAELERRREGVLTALEAVTRAENTLKALILAERTDAEWDRPLLPTDVATLAPVKLDVDDAVSTALANRSELVVLKGQREVSDIDVKYFDNQTKPQVDLVAGYGLTGLAGTPTSGLTPFGGSNAALLARVNELSGALGFEPLPTSAPALVPPQLVGGAGQSLRSLFSNDFKTFRVGVDVALSVGNRTAEANLGRARAEGRKIDAQRQALEQRVEREVRNALQSVQTGRQRVEAAQASRKAAEVQLASEQRRQEAGLSTTFFVLTRQNELADARARELRALTDYTTAVAELQRVLGTTLSAYSIDVEDVQGTAQSE